MLRHELPNGYALRLLEEADADEVFALSRQAFSAADVNFFNCEGVYSDRVVTVPKQHTSGQANVADLAGVARAGFAVAGMANNHAMDLGAEGLFVGSGIFKSADPERRGYDRLADLDEWDEFESLDIYLAWCDRWLTEVARVLFGIDRSDGHHRCRRTRTHGAVPRRTSRP